jgi:hypothetical protein
MYKYFDFKKIFEADESMMPEEGMPSVTVSEPTEVTVNIKELNGKCKLHLLLSGTDVDQLKTQGFLTKTAEWKETDNETKITPMQVLLFNADSGKSMPEVSGEVLRLNLTNQILDRVLVGIDGGNTIEEAISSANEELSGEKVNVSFTREIDVTNVKAGEVAVPSEEGLPAPVEGEIATDEIPESFGRLMKFDDFVNESKKKEKWIKDVDMKKGALKKSLNKKEITSADIAKELKKLEGKDKDKKKEGLQLGKKDATEQKRLVLAKNLMKASGADKKSKKK